MLRQHSFDFGGLDTEATDFELVVVATQVLQPPVGEKAAPVAAAVDPPSFDEWIGRKALSHLHRPVQIAPRYAGATNNNFSGHAGRQRPELLVEHIHPSPR